MSLLKRKTVLALLFVLAILVGISISFLPQLFVRTINSQKKLEIVVVDYHGSLDFSLGNKQKLDELMNVFSDLVFNQNFQRVSIIFTDSVQPQKIFWMNKKNKMVNHLGYEVQVNGTSLDIYLYNNWSALSDSGWGTEKIGRENELLLIRALLSHRSPMGKVSLQQMKEIYLVLRNTYSEPLFYLNYAL